MCRYQIEFTIDDFLSISIDIAEISPKDSIHRIQSKKKKYKIWLNNLKLTMKMRSVMLKNKRIIHSFTSIIFHLFLLLIFQTFSFFSIWDIFDMIKTRSFSFLCFSLFSSLLRSCFQGLYVVISASYNHQIDVENVKYSTKLFELFLDRKLFVFPLMVHYYSSYSWFLFEIILKRNEIFSVCLWSNEIICNIFEIKIIQTKFENLFQRIFFLRLKRIKNKLFFDRLGNHWWCLRLNTAVSQNVIVALFVSPITCRKKIESII
jgi:hypothetical protein